MRCSECGSSQTMNTGKEIICKNCGLILEEDFLEQPFLSDVQIEIAKSRANSPAGTGNINGKIYKSSWFEEYSEKQQAMYNEKLEKYSEKIQIPRHVENKAKEFMRHLFEKKVLRGRSIKAILCACLYASCFEFQLIRTSMEFEVKLGLNKTDLFKSYKFICKELKLKKHIESVPDLIELFTSRLGLPPIKAYEAIALWNKIKVNSLLQQKAQYIVASALIYHVSSKTQREVVAVSGANEVSVRKILKFL